MDDPTADFAATCHLPLDLARTLVRPSLTLRPRPAGAPDRAVGATRSGGVPDLPAWFEWPRHDGRPLVHYLQVALAGLPPISDLPLPAHGLLSFFFDPYDMVAAGNALVAWFPGEVAPGEVPADLHERDRWTPVGFDLGTTWDVPIGEVQDAMGLRRFHGEDAFLDLLDTSRDWGPAHRMGGWWGGGQNEPRICAEAAAGVGHGPAYYERCGELWGHPERFAAWRLLLDLHSTREFGIGDADHACFMIRDADLEARAFDRVQAVWVY